MWTTYYVRMPALRRLTRLRNVATLSVPNGYQPIGRHVANQSASHGIRLYRSATLAVFSAMKLSVTNATKTKSPQPNRSVTMSSAFPLFVLSSGQRWVSSSQLLNYSWKHIFYAPISLPPVPTISPPSHSLMLRLYDVNIFSHACYCFIWLDS